MEVKNVALNYFYVASKSKSRTAPGPVMVRWTKPDEN